MLKADTKLTVFFLLIGLDVLPEHTFSIIVGYIFGVGMKLAFSWDNNTLTKKSATLIVTCSMATTYGIVTLYEHNKWTVPLGLIIMLGSFVSVFLITEIEKLIKAYVSKRLKDFTDRYKIKDSEDV